MTDDVRHAREIRRLRDRIDELEEELRQLRAEVVPTTLLPQWIGLTTRENKLLIGLLNAPGAVARHDYLRLYHGSPDIQRNTFSVYFSKIRGRLRAAGLAVDILPVRGIGYTIDDMGRRTLLDILRVQDELRIAA